MKEVYQISSSMLHSWSSYDLTLSLYNHVQNDCQIYQPVGIFCFGLFFLSKNCIFFLVWKMLPIWSLFCGGSFCCVFRVAQIVFLYAHCSGNGSPSEESLPAILVLPSGTQTHTVGPFLSVIYSFIYLLLLTL